MTYLQWLEEISEWHPVIKYYPIEQWEDVTRFNGWLPLPIYHIELKQGGKEKCTK